MAALPPSVKIVEVGPRDGLQNESVTISTEQKLAYILSLVDAGLTQIEVTSFVSPKSIPQLADAMEVVRRLPVAPHVTFSALVPNEKGLDRAIESGIRRIAVFTGASETFTKKNINMTIEESLAVFKPVTTRALANGLSVRGYLSTSFVCPYEGAIAKERVLELCLQLLEMGIDEIAVSDTVGAATPENVLDTCALVLGRVPVSNLALHFHDTYGRALENVKAGLQLGVATYDASTGGMGGCPFAPGAAGNLATEALVRLLSEMGIRTEVDSVKLLAAGAFIRGIAKRPNQA